MKCRLIIILALSFSTISFAQNDPWSKAMTLKTGYMCSNWHSVELGIEWLHLIGSTREYYGTYGMTIGSDFLFDKKIIYGPKLCAEAHLGFVGTRINATCYTADIKSGSFKMRPEVGLTLLGLFNVFYGRTFNISNPTFYPQKHSISVFCNIPIFPYRGRKRIVDYDNKELKN
jgi:hypothetical protein